MKNKSKLKCYSKVVWADIKEFIKAACYIGLLFLAVMLWIYMWFRFGGYVSRLFEDDFLGVVAAALGIFISPVIIFSIRQYIVSIKERCK